MIEAKPQDLFSVKGKVVVVTGGCGQLGGQFTRELIERGARVAVFDLEPDRCVSPEPQMAAGSADNFLAVAVDVTRRASIEGGLATVKSKWGPPQSKSPVARRYYAVYLFASRAVRYTSTRLANVNRRTCF